MSINDFDKLRTNLSNYNFVNASHLIWKLRIVKSQNEITKIKKIISIASEVFDNLPNQMHIGMTEIEFLEKNLHWKQRGCKSCRCRRGKKTYRKIYLHRCL